MRPYEDEIEKSIIRIAYERKQKAKKGFDQSKQTKEGRHRTCKCQKHEISSGELKRELEHQYRNGRKMSWTLVSSRLNQMVGSNTRNSRYLVNPILIKRDLNRGSNTCYSLTRDAEIRYKLKVPFFKERGISETAYQLLLIYASLPDLVIRNSDGHDVPVRYKFLDSESEFDEFLHKIHIRKENLASSYFDTVESKEIIKLTPKERQEDIKIFKTGVDGGGGSIYSYVLPGISIDEVLTYIHSYPSPLSIPRLTDEEVKECFELLQGEGLLKRIRSLILEYLDETERYEIAREPLREFLHYSLRIKGLALYRMISTWKCRKPKDEEKVWFALFEGRKGAEDSFRKLNDERKSLKGNPKKKEMEQQRILNDDKAMLEAYTIFKELYTGVIAEYSFITDVLVEWSYPTFLRDLQEKKLV